MFIPITIVDLTIIYVRLTVIRRLRSLDDLAYEEDFLFLKSHASFLIILYRYRA